MAGKYQTVIIDGKKVVVDETGKPCRACNTLTDFQSVMKMGSQPTPANPARADPPDVAQLGRHTWTFLHSLAAYYPSKPSIDQQQDMSQFIRSFANFYPCQMCAEDFREYIKTHEPKVTSRDDLSMWFCQAHNEVNKKLMKPVFDCSTWRQRWLEGWD